MKPAARCVSLLLLLLTAASVSATTVRRHGLESLSASADLLVRGRVTALVGHAPVDRHPFRLARLEVLEDLGGSAPEILWVRLPGGADARGRQWLVPGVPEPEIGGEWLLYLERVPELEAARPTVPAGAEARNARGAIARPARGPQPSPQYLPVALSLSVWEVTGELARPVPEARSLALAGPPPPGAPLPGESSLAVLRMRLQEAWRRGRAESP